MTSPLPNEPTPPRDLAYYRSLAQEAVRGRSLWEDAWRRLRRNRLAMFAAAYLITLATLAFITPLLPLQSPRLQDVKARPYLPPSTTPFALEITNHEGKRTRLTELVVAHRQLERSAEGKSSVSIPTHPYSVLWNRPDWFTSRLIDLRLTLFGDWCLPSLFGTDQLGRDVLSRVLWGARVSLTVGFVAASVSLLIGVSYGAISGYCGGWIDAAMMRIVDTLYSIPFLFVVIFIITLLSDEKIKVRLEAVNIDRITIFYMLIGAIFWLTMARVVRGQVLSLKHEQFVDAARVSGASSLRIIFRHLVPNVMGIVIIYLTLTIPSVMLFEAALSYLGLGVRPPDVSWGMLADEGLKVITPVKTYWWLVFFPSLALASTLLALNVLGDGLRDALDPRLKNR